ncbi:hypothetical protein MNEG_15496 [Monoraphidium neglectum]|uniref:TECPR1-like DysF domain-containing protein n=1 Tax=Monoraphidium neglectum TaxID=145388 RepID=A0A0D2IWV3_9CHLO|nr:hypothetical protein MNEG_15496 [Monoraphidium neglectum]KIY92467.1 hypothetical protein MNEG_15496 [Monoraphidium neglectum]|eukprot:XP_013891487.1 hypothetical protein MNEG_15496 [Monoraphidium neglectum]
MDSVQSSSEGLRSFVSGAWLRPAAEPARFPSPQQQQQQQGGGGANGGGGGGTPTHRQSVSFSASLDPSGFTLIEDYAQAGAAGPPAAAASPGAAAAPTAPSPAAAPRAAPPRPAGAGPGTPPRSASPSKSPGGAAATAANTNGGGGGALAASLPAGVGLDWLRGSPLGGGINALGTLGTLGAGLVNASSGMFAVPGPEPDTVDDGDEPADEAFSEVYEHERVQPFRGWGHSWPGHFLPSDRVGHWGDRWGRPGGPMSMLFESVVPRLPAGWEWAEDEWHVDMTGAEEDGVDAEGWSYSVDFSYFTWPPQPGQGKATMKTWVRRRRWVRARIRVQGAAGEPAQEAAAEAAGPAGDAERQQPQPQPLQRSSAPGDMESSASAGEGGGGGGGGGSAPASPRAAAARALGSVEGGLGGGRRESRGLASKSVPLQSVGRYLDSSDDEDAVEHADEDADEDGARGGAEGAGGGVGGAAVGAT